MPDFLFPLARDNRPEYIVMELEGFIISHVELLLQGFRLKYYDKFPQISTFDQIVFDDFYHNFSFLEPREFTKFITNQSLSDKEMDEMETDIYATLDNYDLIHDTVGGHMLTKLLAPHNFVKEIYLVLDRKIYPADAKYLLALLPTDPRVHVVEGNIDSFILDHPELTSFFVNRYQTIETLMTQTPIPQGKMFFLRNNSNNMDIKINVETHEVDVIMLYDDILTPLFESTTSEYARLSIDCIPTNPNGDSDIIPVG